MDVTTAGTRYDTMKATLDVLTAAPEFDLVLCVVGSSARFHPELAVKPILDSAGGARPLAAFLVPEAPEALAALSAAGVPSFRTPEACADAIAAAFRRRVPRAIEVRPKPMAQSDGRLLDELEACKLLDRLGIACAPSVALDSDTVSAPALPFAYPVAVKALGGGIAHKTDLGGVALNVKNADALIAAIRSVVRSVSAHSRESGNPEALASTLGARLRGDERKKIDRVLVQPMIAGLGEALVGYRVDRDVGPLVMVAAGGVLTEIYRDRSLRLAPVDVATAREMISEVRGLAPLAGYRGKPKGDLDALAHTIVALSQLAVSDEPVIEAEINPLIVRAAGEGAIAVDALVKLL
jgi:acyl-CoA synthetase (NDP forming)